MERYTGQNLADIAGVEGITFRRFIRADGTRVGRGKAYKFDRDEARAYLAAFLGVELAEAEELLSAE